jgi:hypothetical protein
MDQAMTIHRHTAKSNSAFERVKQRLHPRSIAEGMASAFERAPIAFVFVAVLAPAVAVISALGVRGAIGAPLPIALLLGVLGVYAQCALFSMIRIGNGPRVRLWIFLLAVSFWNAVSLAAGVVAANPDAMGRALIARQLNATVQHASAKAATLETLAARFDVLAFYSADAATRESLPSKEAGWVATCPNSSGPGVGTITNWRRATGGNATARAATLRNAALSARRSAAVADGAARSYSIFTHDQSMRSISAAVEAISAASAAADREGMTTMLNTLAAETGEGGTCPDANLQNLIATVRSVQLAELDRASTFAALPRPSEAEAVDDLWTQVMKGADGDFALYAIPLGISPFLDWFLMTMLGLIVPRRRPEDDDATIAESIGIDPSEADLLGDAFEAAAADPHWTEMVARTENVGGRWIRVKRIRINLDDWANLHKMRHLVELGRVRDGGVVDGQHVFVLRPHFLFDRFNQLVRKNVVNSRMLTITPIMPKSEMQQ